MKPRWLLPGLFLFGVCALAWWTLQTPFWQNVQRISGAMRLIHREYVDAGAVDYDRLGDAAIRGMAEGLDPYSAYLPAPEFSHFEELSAGAYVGIGVTIERLRDRVTVTRVFARSPAAAGGVQAGDQIAAVDGVTMVDATVNEVSSALRGRAGDPVDLTLDRPTDGSVLQQTLIRGAVPLTTVEDVALTGDGIGSLHITQFNDRTAQEFRAALAELSAGGMRGLIVDLRHNPGGLLRTSKEVAGIFFRPGELIVYVQGRERIDREDFLAGHGGQPPSFPIVVLVNEQSASGAEIVAGAWQDAGIATIMGETTHGKGSVQSVFHFRNGDGLRQTTARYYLPSGRSIHGIGVEPDISVPFTDEEEVRLQLQSRHAGHMTNADFEAAFGFAPDLVDAPREAALQQLRAALPGRV